MWITYATMITRINRYGNTNAAAAMIASKASSGATMLWEILNVWILRIGMRLTTNRETATIQVMTTISAASVDHHGPGHCILAASGPIAPMAPAGAGMPVK